MRVDPEKLISALIASHPGMKLDYNAIARAYGDGANYNTIEHKFRRYRKEAEQLRAQAQTDGNGPTTFTPQPRAGKAQRARQTRSEPASSPNSKTPRRKSTKAKKLSPIVLSDSDETPTPIKADVKRENDATKALLGITDIASDDEEDLAFKKRKRGSTASSELHLSPSFGDESDPPPISSRENPFTISVRLPSDMQKKGEDVAATTTTDFVGYADSEEI